MSRSQVERSCSGRHGDESGAEVKPGSRTWLLSQIPRGVRPNHCRLAAAARRAKSRIGHS